MKAWFCAALLLSCSSARAETLLCHVTYGGETRTLEAQPSASPYTVPAIAIGSYFLFRPVFQRDAIKMYVYADRDGDHGPLLLHQVSFPYPPPAAAQYGFSGLHLVYEPKRDGELQYWCELAP